VLFCQPDPEAYYKAMAEKIDAKIVLAIRGSKEMDSIKHRHTKRGKVAGTN